MSDLVRESVDLLLNEKVRSSIVQRALNAPGKYRSGHDDINVTTRRRGDGRIRFSEAHKFSVPPGDYGWISQGNLPPTVTKKKC